MSVCRCPIFVMIGVLITSTSNVSSSEPETNLVALIPPGAALVLGLEARRSDTERPYLFTPLPEKSLRDLDYFNSLCGADPTKSVREVIIVDGDLDRANYDHALLATGHFNYEVLSKSALSQGATKESYRGLTVFRVPPLARERLKFDEITWLTIIDSRFLLVGTPAYIRQEMDRVIERKAPESFFSEQIATVHRSDVWWIISRPSDTSAVKEAVMSLSPDLGELLTKPNIMVEMRYGRKVVFEYHLVSSESSKLSSARNFTSHGSPTLNRFAPGSGETIRSHGIIKIDRDRYQRWIAEIATRPTHYR